MWRKFTVYGLRFSKTSFWNRINTGFLDPAVATVLTACGIETYVESFVALPTFNVCCNSAYRLRYWNWRSSRPTLSTFQVATVLTACGIETVKQSIVSLWMLMLQQCLPLAVLKPDSLPRLISLKIMIVATVLTACGIETLFPLEPSQWNYQYSCNSAYRLRYWNTRESFSGSI